MNNRVYQNKFLNKALTILQYLSGDRTLPSYLAQDFLEITKDKGAFKKVYDLLETHLETYQRLYNEPCYLNEAFTHEAVSSVFKGLPEGDSVPSVVYLLCEERNLLTLRANALQSDPEVIKRPEGYGYEDWKPQPKKKTTFKSLSELLLKQGKTLEKIKSWYVVFDPLSETSQRYKYKTLKEVEETML